MKSTNTEKEKEEKPAFPCLKKWIEEYNDPFVVLFSEPRAGTVVWTENSSWKIGDYHEEFVSFDNSSWEDFSEKIILEN